MKMHWTIIFPLSMDHDCTFIMNFSSVVFKIFHMYKRSANSKHSLYYLLSAAVPNCVVQYYVLFFSHDNILFVRMFQRCLTLYSRKYIFKQFCLFNLLKEWHMTCLRSLRNIFRYQCAALKADMANFLWVHLKSQNAL